MKKQLPKPENWQDFETLCKKLWGEIWNIPNKIKKNGRQGQPQHGVDVYGIPERQQNYWGIQCKGKDDYTKAQLTEKEIDIEIQKARKFQPELATFIFATTANKDSKIEQYIRIKDVENRKADSFEILLFCWEDIVDLIEENRNTYNFYVQSQHFRAEFDFQVLINDSEAPVLTPKYYKTTRIYKVKKPTYNPRYPGSGALFLDGGGIRSSTRRNLARCRLTFTLQNIGGRVIEDWKVLFSIQGEYEELSDADPDIDRMGINKILRINSALTLKDNKFGFQILSPLIQKDSRTFDLWLKPKERPYELLVNWKILARDFDKEGAITIDISPEYEERELTCEVDYHHEMREPHITIDEKIDNE